MALTAGPGLEAGLRLLGVPWPDEDEHALREVAAAYRAFADTLDTQAAPTMTAGVATAAAAGDDWAGSEAESIHRNRYLVAERIYLEETDPLSRMDVVIDNTVFDRPRIR